MTESDFRKLSPAEQFKYVTELNTKREVAEAAQKAAQALTLKVSEKGAVSVYGMGKWPITLYKSQMRRLLAMKTDIEAFMAANDSKLKDKATAPA